MSEIDEVRQSDQATAKSDCVGVVFVGHGTRLQKGVDAFYDFTKRVEDRVLWTNAPQADASISADTHPSIVFTHGFLELATPDIPTALRQAVQRGATRLVVVPLFLLEAGHMKSDVPALIESTRPDLQGIPLEVLPAVGDDDVFASVVGERIRCASTSGSAGHDAVLLVGRGNKDAAAQQTFERLAQKVDATLPPSHTMAVGYLAGTGEPWRDVLSRLAASGHRHVLIQPYLWFPGWLTDKLPEWIASWRAEHGADAALRIDLGDPLGSHPAIVGRMADRVRAAVTTPVASAAPYYPAFLDLHGKLCVVVGGGSVATRKVRKLLEAGAHVRVVSPDLTAQLREWVDGQWIQWMERTYQDGDLAGAWLVYTATNDAAVNRKVAEAATAQRLFVNVADDALQCSLTVPASVRRGTLQVAISTSGRHPAVARKLRQALEVDLDVGHDANLAEDVERDGAREDGVADAGDADPTERAEDAPRGRFVEQARRYVAKREP